MRVAVWLGHKPNLDGKKTNRKFLKCFRAENVVQIIGSVAKLVNLPLESQVMHLDGQINEYILGNDLHDQKS